MNPNQIEMNTEILLILTMMISDAGDSQNDFVVFLEEHSLRIYSSILHSNPIRDHVSTVYEHLSLIFDSLER